MYYIDVRCIDNLHIMRGGKDMSIDKSLISGSTSMLVMKLLEEQDMYGYQMIAALKKRSNNVFELKAGTLYPLLHGKESKGYLTSYEQEEGGKKTGVQGKEERF